MRFEKIPPKKRGGKWRVRIREEGNSEIMWQGQGYTLEQSADKVIALTKAQAADAPVIEVKR